MRGVRCACCPAVYARRFRVIGCLSSLLGLCLGIGLAQAALVISRIYSETYRPSMLVATDGSFSLAGFRHGISDCFFAHPRRAMGKYLWFDSC